MSTYTTPKKQFSIPAEFLKHNGMEQHILRVCTIFHTDSIIPQNTQFTGFFPQSAQSVFYRAVCQISVKINEEAVFPIPVFDWPALDFGHVQIIILGWAILLWCRVVLSVMLSNFGLCPGHYKCVFWQPSVLLEFLKDTDS